MRSDLKGLFWVGSKTPLLDPTFLGAFRSDPNKEKTPEILAAVVYAVDPGVSRLVEPEGGQKLTANLGVSPMLVWPGRPLGSPSSRNE